MTPVVNDIMRVVMAFNIIGGVDEFSNTMHFKVISATWADNLAFMLDIALFMDAAYTLQNGEMSAAIGYKDIDAQNLTQVTLLPLVPWPVLVGGANASELLPTQVAARPFWPTLRPKTRAAINLPTFGETSQSQGGLMDATAVAAVEAFADQFVGVMSLALGSLQYGAFNPEFVRFTPVDSRVVPTRFRTLRRRRLGVGS